MYISYFDETGDDGYPEYSSKIFVLTSIYIHHQNWKDTYSKIYSFRKKLKEKYGLPINKEFHTKNFLLGKNPYRDFGFDEKTRIEIMKKFAKFISSLDIKAVNVCINKDKINKKNESSYKNILDVALRFNIQRIENDLKKDTKNKYLIITDEGRVGKMRMTARKIQRINFIPSLYSKHSYREEIKLLIEDPLPKNSRESHFIQIADFISFIVYLILLKKLKVAEWHNRLSFLQVKDVIELMDLLEPIFNKEASKGTKYGIVCYPK